MGGQERKKKERYLRGKVRKGNKLRMFERKRKERKNLGRFRKRNKE